MPRLAIQASSASALMFKLKPHTTVAPPAMKSSATAMRSQRRGCAIARQAGGRKFARRMVADAVTYEPVSTLKFPANREKNREFRRIRPLSAILKADTRANSKACSEIPYATEQGIISAEQGILAQEQGIFACRKPKSSPEEAAKVIVLVFFC